MSLFLGIDVGTQSTKCVVYNAKEGRAVASGSYPYDVKRTDVPGRAEQSPSVWIEVTLETLSLSPSTPPSMSMA
eukprot:scaffold660989_cov66-Prasinocladus_malaysianus.AAC.1